MGNAKDPKSYPLPVFATLGALFIALAWILFLGLSSEFSVVEVTANTLFAVGFAILTVVILQALWSAFGGDPIQRSVDRLVESASLLEDSHRAGVRRIFMTSASFGSESDWLQLLSNAKHKGQVDLMGYTLRSWLTGNFQSCILELLDKGVVVRILLMGTENQLFGKRGNATIVHQLQTDLSAECDQTMRVIRDLMKKGDGKPGSIEARKVTTGSIKCSLTRVDAQILVVPYLFSAPASSAPLFVANNDGEDGGLFSTYEREFGALWEDSYSSPIETTEATAPDAAREDMAAPGPAPEDR